jgi:REP element-mobilizing transposase RayT
MIDEATRSFLDEYFRRIAIREDIEIISLAFLKTHVHVLVRVNPRVDVPRVVQLRKGGSSYAASRQPGNVIGLRWNREYSVTSVSPRLVPQALRYIKSQDSRHPTEAISGFAVSRLNEDRRTTPPA